VLGEASMVLAASIPERAVSKIEGGRAGEPRSRPDRVLADKAYTSAANRAYLDRQGIRTNR